MNLAETGTASCKSRTDSTARDDSSRKDRSGTSYHRCHGEARAIGWSRKLNPALESSVWISTSPLAGETRSQIPVVKVHRLGAPSHRGRVDARSPKQRRPARPGVKPDTYRTKGDLLEHGNLDASAGSGNARQAARSSDVSHEGRSLRSSPSTGEPCTRRREAVGARSGDAAGESHVCGVRARPGLAPERATQAVCARQGAGVRPPCESNLWRARCSTKGARRVRRRALRNRTA